MYEHEWQRDIEENPDSWLNQLLKEEFPYSEGYEEDPNEPKHHDFTRKNNTKQKDLPAAKPTGPSNLPNAGSG